MPARVSPVMFSHLTTCHSSRGKVPTPSARAAAQRRARVGPGGDARGVARRPAPVRGEGRRAAAGAALGAGAYTFQLNRSRFGHTSPSPPV